MEKVRVVTKQGFIHVCNHIGERGIEYINNNEFTFEKGKIYGLIGEHGSGGEIISSLLSGRIKLNENVIYFDDVKVNETSIQDSGWYVGKNEYAAGIIKKEMSAKKAINSAINKYHRYENINEIIEDFHLTSGRLNYELSKYSGERMRVSLAIGYANNKTIYCFPWMNTGYFYDIILSSGVFRFFKRLKEEGCIIILPTSRKENVAGLVDEVIEIDNPRFKQVISESEYFKQYF